ncbi:MAG: DUF1320 domain-containing protein [Betaproteobacteria bacterium]|nr:DUF1320 domain-containing protein [Betaproteobacteria bacterium]
MTYATQQDLVDRFGSQEILELTDRASAGSIDATVVARALADADAEIDGYLIGRYALPLASTPRVLTLVACDLARYRLYEDRATDAVRQRYEDQVRFLRALADGKIALGPDAGGSLPAQAADAVEFEPGQKVFGREDL